MFMDLAFISALETDSYKLVKSVHFSTVAIFNLAPMQDMLPQFHPYRNIGLVVGFPLLACTLFSVFRVAHDCAS